MRRLFPVALLILLVAAPGASACSIVLSRDFETLTWLDGGTLLTNHQYETGRYRLADESFEVLGSTFFQNPQRAALSPDGRIFVHSFQEGLDASCKGDWEGVFALDTSAGKRETLTLRQAWVVGGEWGVLLARYDGSLRRVHEWGEWTQGRSLSVDVEGARPYALQGADRIVLWHQQDREVRLVDVVRDKVVWTLKIADADEFHEPALSPDGAYLALSIADRGATPSSWLRIYRTGGSSPQLVEELQASDRNGFGPLGLDWGQAGLAWTLSSAVRLFPEAPDLGEVRSFGAASDFAGAGRMNPSGTRLAVGTEDGLVVYDLAANTNRTYKPDPSPRSRFGTVEPGQEPIVEEEPIFPFLPGAPLGVVLAAFIGVVALRRRSLT